MSTTLFETVELAPRDPILGLTEAFKADTRPEKVNLGVGVYTDDEGKVPLLRAVREAEKQLVERGDPRGYLPIEGLGSYLNAVRQLVFEGAPAVLDENRVASFEALGGTGALRVGADFLKRLKPDAGVYISNPSWENHRALFEAAGFKVNPYPYYDEVSHGLRFDAMIDTLDRLNAGSIVVLHACCHNPTGVDLNAEQWRRVVEVAGKRRLVPFLDMAYQGFAEGVGPDAQAVRLFAESGLSFFVANSFSKSFSLYGERVGALSIVTASADETTRVVSQVKRVIRTNYSNPPTHGAAIVAAVLSSPPLRALWEEELTGMRNRIQSMRDQLVGRIEELGVRQDFSFVRAQRGMFSFSGLTTAQVHTLRDTHGIYAVDTGRICLAALNSHNLEAVARAIASVV